MLKVITWEYDQTSALTNMKANPSGIKELFSLH